MKPVREKQETNTAWFCAVDINFMDFFLHLAFAFLIRKPRAGIPAVNAEAAGVCPFSAGPRSVLLQGFVSRPGQAKEVLLQPEDGLPNSSLILKKCVHQ